MLAGISMVDKSQNNWSMCARPVCCLSVEIRTWQSKFCSCFGPHDLQHTLKWMLCHWWFEIQFLSFWGHSVTVIHIFQGPGTFHRAWRVRERRWYHVCFFFPRLPYFTSGGVLELRGVNQVNQVSRVDDHHARDETVFFCFFVCHWASRPPTLLFLNNNKVVL